MPMLATGSLRGSKGSDTPVSPTSLRRPMSQPSPPRSRRKGRASPESYCRARSVAGRLNALTLTLLTSTNPTRADRLSTALNVLPHQNWYLAKRWDWKKRGISASPPRATGRGSDGSTQSMSVLWRICSMEWENCGMQQQ